MKTKREKLLPLCDMCGKEIRGEVFPLLDEQYRQTGSQCEHCFRIELNIPDNED